CLAREHAAHGFSRNVELFTCGLIDENFPRSLFRDCCSELVDEANGFNRIVEEGEYLRVFERALLDLLALRPEPRLCQIKGEDAAPAARSVCGDALPALEPGEPQALPLRVQANLTRALRSA